MGIHGREPQAQEEHCRKQHVHRHRETRTKPAEAPAHIVKEPQEDPKASGQEKFRRLTADLLDHRNSRVRKPPWVAALS